MTKLPVRLTLLFLSVAAVGYAAFFFWSSEQHLRLTDNSSRRFEATARAVSVGVVELRAAQQAYVAAGQGEDFWFARVTAIVKDLDDRLSTLKSGATVPEAVAAVAEAAGGGVGVWAVGRDEGGALGGAAGVASLGLLLLLPTGRKPPEPATVSIARPTPSVSAETLADLRDFGVAAAPLPPVTTARSSVDLGGMAALCVDLARIQKTPALPALLDRAAVILQASGIVLWIADPDGRELTPTVVHGYSPQLASRFGTISRDAENVTASAYRTGLLQTMKGDAISNGAVAAPLITAAGSVGVMAAELKNGGEQDHALLAATTIIAAQLATLVGPPSARAKTEAVR